MMIGLKQLSSNRMELYGSRFPLETLQPFLLERYANAYATIVLYEDNIEAYHETGIFRFDASEPETFNYEEFRAPLLAEFHDRLAVCTVENLFLHLARYMEARPWEDDPFHNLVFSITPNPPPEEILLNWEKTIDQQLRQALFDKNTSDHLHLFPNEACVVYSHGNHFTSITSDDTGLIQFVFEDMVEKQLSSISKPPLPPEFIYQLYCHLKTYGAIRLKTERVHKDKDGTLFLLVTYPGASTWQQKRVARITVDTNGVPQALEAPQWISRLQYQLKYSDPYLLPMVVLTVFMLAVVSVAVYFKILSPGHTPPL